jgi:hypothetical protein
MVISILLIEDVKLIIESVYRLYRAPADKHPQIAPIEYEHWIKTHANTNQPQVNVSRKRSVLSNVSYHSEEDDSDTTDEEDEAVTPTLVVKPELTGTLQEKGLYYNTNAIQQHCQEMRILKSTAKRFGAKKCSCKDRQQTLLAQLLRSTPSPIKLEDRKMIYI